MQKIGTTFKIYIIIWWRLIGYIELLDACLSFFCRFGGNWSKLPKGVYKTKTFGQFLQIMLWKEPEPILLYFLHPDGSYELNTILFLGFVFDKICKTFKNQPFFLASLDFWYRFSLHINASLHHYIKKMSGFFCVELSASKRYLRAI